MTDILTRLMVPSINERQDAVSTLSQRSSSPHFFTNFQNTNLQILSTKYLNIYRDIKKTRNHKSTNSPIHEFKVLQKCVLKSLK